MTPSSSFRRALPTFVGLLRAGAAESPEALAYTFADLDRRTQPRRPMSW